MMVSARIAAVAAFVLLAGGQALAEPVRWVAPNGLFSLAAPEGWQAKRDPDAPPSVLTLFAPAYGQITERRLCAVIREAAPGVGAMTRLELNAFTARRTPQTTLARAAPSAAEVSLVEAEHQVIDGVAINTVAFHSVREGARLTTVVTEFALRNDSSYNTITCMLYGRHAPTDGMDALAGSLRFAAAAE